jgi:hypothetical protein
MFVVNSVTYRVKSRSEGRFSKHRFYTNMLLRLGKGIHLNYTLKFRIKPMMRKKGVLNFTEAKFKEELGV